MQLNAQDAPLEQPELEQPETQSTSSNSTQMTVTSANTLLSEKKRLAPNVPNADFNDYKPLLDTAERYIKDNKISPAISQFISLIHQLQQRLEQSVGLFFPETLGPFVSTNGQKLPAGIDDQTNRFGVLFERHYEDASGNTIDVNAIYDSGAISDYIAVINNPRLLRNLNNTTIARVQDKYDAIEKFSPKDNYHERNILISNQLLVNVVILGSVDQELMDAFCNSCYFEELDQFLTSQSN